MAIKTKELTAMQAITNYVGNLKYEALPEQTVEITKRSILDTLACAIAGSSFFGGEQLVNLARRWGGSEQATMLVFGGRAPAPWAALANCTMARALDMDDTIETAFVHPNAAIIPTSFVIAEYCKAVKNRAVNGKEFLVACTIGTDMICRIRQAGKDGLMKGGWVSETFAPIPEAAIGARMLGFDEEKMMNAIGIAYSQCAGSITAVVEGALTVRLQQGLSGKAGVMAVVLADEGFSSGRDIFEGKYGLYNVYARGEYDREILLGELGKRFRSNEVSVKPYPTCKFTHGAIYNTLQLVEKHNIKPSDVAKVTVTTCTYFNNLLGGEDKVAPQRMPQAQFSLYYTVASAIVRREMFIGELTDNALREKSVLDMAKKVRVVVDPGKDKMAGTPPTDVEIVTRDGKSYKSGLEFVPGHPNNPMSLDDVIKKFKKCLKFSARPLSEKKVDQAISMILDMDKLDDVTPIVQLLA
ncbi:MAG: MmgE/PrpD family protein [Chloroflexi bacterium]|nr:MmgE/PrpD family protein [Chloroflexota bacterium]